jgi:hypothetical protein
LVFSAARDWIPSRDREVCKEDAAVNDEALKEGFRLFTAYPIDLARPCKGFGENTLWIITEAARSGTTFLLPSEY